jgi:hypothetical protein
MSSRCVLVRGVGAVAAAVAFGLVMSCAGCGGGSEVTGPIVSKGALVRHFPEETGLRLFRHPLLSGDGFDALVLC